MATNYFSYRTCSLRAKVSQDPLDRFSQSLHHMVRIEWQMIKPVFCFRYLKGRCHGNQLKSKNWRFLRTNLICRTAIRNRIAISQFQFQKIRLNEYLYIVYNFGGIRSRNLRVYAVNNSTSLPEAVVSSSSLQTVSTHCGHLIDKVFVSRPDLYECTVF